jgi:hypothetical protein
MKPADGKLIDILLVEDDAADVRLTREALKGATVKIRLHGYVIKPVELDQFLKAVRSMEGFLVGIVDTPPATEHDGT